jgi:hypothetical protein
MKDWTIIFLGVISAVIAALAVEWLNRTFNSPTASANDLAWNHALAGPGSPEGLPNFNLRPDNPAFTYQGGAPVTNYREFQRVGVLQVPVE